MADRSAPEKRAGPPAFHLKQVNVLGGTALCGQRAVPPRPFSVKAKGQRGRGLRGPCTLRQGAVPLASRSANGQQAETKQYPPGWEGKFASSWAGENVAMGRKKTRFLPAHCRIFPARFARLRPALPAAQERHWTAPEDGSRVQWALVRDVGGEEPPTSPFAARRAQHRSPLSTPPLFLHPRRTVPRLFTQFQKIACVFLQIPV